MKKTILVTVNRGRINAGVRADSERCPIALAVRAHKGFNWATVGSEWVSVVSRRGLTKLRAPLPAMAMRFMADFDSGWRGGPCKFKLTFTKP